MTKLIKYRCWKGIGLDSASQARCVGRLAQCDPCWWYCWSRPLWFLLKRSSVYYIHCGLGKLAMPIAISTLHAHDSGRMRHVWQESVDAVLSLSTAALLLSHVSKTTLETSSLCVSQRWTEGYCTFDEWYKRNFQTWQHLASFLALFHRRSMGNWYSHNASGRHWNCLVQGYRRVGKGHDMSRFWLT